MNTTVKHIGAADASSSDLLRVTGNENMTFDGYHDHGELEHNDRENTCFDNEDNASEKGPVNAVDSP